jgi:hypothetical protein
MTFKNRRIMLRSTRIFCSGKGLMSWMFYPMDGESMSPAGYYDHSVPGTPHIPSDVIEYIINY